LLLLALVTLPPGLTFAAEFERTLPASPGTSLDVRLFGGEVAVRAWNKDEVRVRATHFSTDEIQVAEGDGAITVRARATTGKPHGIDFEINVPAWMAVSTAGSYLDISVEGTEADVTARTVRGDVRVSGGAGKIVLASVEGEVSLEGSRGDASVESANNGVRVSGLAGNLLAETVSGYVRLSGVSGKSVVVSSVSGEILWEGPLAKGGTYELATHSGDLDVALPAGTDASVSVRSFEGHINSSLAVPLPDLPSRRKRFTLKLGQGSGSTMELESFTGTISLRQR
jgi:hypothetical protein